MLEKNKQNEIIRDIFTAINGKHEVGIMALRCGGDGSLVLYINSKDTFQNDSSNFVGKFGGLST